MHLVHDESDGAWVHTHGLDAFDLPELEIRGIKPRYLGSAAAGLLKEICDYMLNSGNTVHLGENMLLGQRTRVRFDKSRAVGAARCHYEVERWTVIHDDSTVLCDMCAALGEQKPAYPSRKQFSAGAAQR